MAGFMVYEMTCITCDESKPKDEMCFFSCCIIDATATKCLSCCPEADPANPHSQGTARGMKHIWSPWRYYNLSTEWRECLTCGATEQRPTPDPASPPEPSPPS